MGEATKIMEIKAISLIVVLLLCIQITIVSASQIIIEDADTIWNTSSEYSSDITNITSIVTPRILTEYANTIYHCDLSSSTDLINVTSSVTPRILTEYANAIYHSDLLIPSTNLINVTSGVTPRIMAEYANSIYRNDLNKIPAGLTNLTNEVSLKRLTIEYANSNYYEELIFPKELMNDTMPPIIADVSVINVTDTSAVITWRTDEFADSMVKYGENSTVYTKICKDNLFAKAHVVALTGLSPGTKYYFVVNSTDRSGNSAESSEYSFIILEFKEAV